MRLGRCRGSCSRQLQQAEQRIGDVIGWQVLGLQALGGDKSQQALPFEFAGHSRCSTEPAGQSWQLYINIVSASFVISEQEAGHISCCVVCREAASQQPQQAVQRGNNRQRW